MSTSCEVDIVGIEDKGRGGPFLGLVLIRLSQENLEQLHGEGGLFVGLGVITSQKSIGV